MSSARVDLIIQARDARAAARDIRGVDSAVDGVGRSAERTSRRSRAANASARALQGTLRSVATASKYGVAGIAALGATSVKTAANFEQSVSSLGSVTGAQGAALDQLRNQALKAGAATAFSAREAVVAQTELAKGGVTTADIMRGGLNSALALAAAGELELADAAATTANAMNLFGLQGKSAGHIADALATAANATTADVSDFAIALSQGGAAAKAAGLDFDQTVLGLEALANAGVKGSDAGTSFKSMMTQLASPTKESAALMRQLNLDFFGANGKMKDLASVSGMLRSRFGKLNHEQRLQAATTLAGTDGMRGLLALYDSSPAKLRKLEQGLQREGSAAETARRKQDNLKGALEQLGGSWETLQVIVGTALIPVLTDVTQETTKVVNALAGGATEGSALADVFKQFGAGIRGDLLTPMGGAAGAAQDVGAAFRAAWPQIKEFARNIDLRALLDGVEASAGPLGAVLGGVTDALDNPTVQQAAVAVIGLGVAYKGLNAVSGGAVGGIVAFAGGAGKATLATAHLVTQIVAYRTAKMTLNAALVTNTGVTAANTTAHNVSTLSLARAKVATIGHSVATRAAAGATAAWTAGQWLLNAAMSANPIALVVAGIAVLVGAFVLAYKNIEWFRNAVDAVWRWMKTAVSSVVRWYIDRWGDVIGFFTGLPGKISSATSGMWDGIKDAFRGAINWIIRGWNSLEFRVPAADLGPLGEVGGFTLGVPDIPQLATGGVVKQGGWAVVGERGPELLRAPGGSTVFDAAQTAGALAGAYGRPATPGPVLSSGVSQLDSGPLMAAVRAALEGVVLEVHSHLETDGREQGRSVRRVALKDAIVRSAT